VAEEAPGGLGFRLGGLLRVAGWLAAGKKTGGSICISAASAVEKHIFISHLVFEIM
jgi:hypothetical protein